MLALSFAYDPLRMSRVDFFDGSEILWLVLCGRNRCNERWPGRNWLPDEACVGVRL